MVKLLFIPLDLLFLGVDSLRGLFLAFRNSRNASEVSCPYCRPARTDTGSIRRVEIADKYFNTWVFRLICPSVEDAPTEDSRIQPRQCTQADPFSWSKTRSGLGLLLCILTWGGSMGAVAFLEVPQRALAKIAALQENGQTVDTESPTAATAPTEPSMSTEQSVASAQASPMEERIRQLETMVRRDRTDMAARRELIDCLVAETRYQRALIHLAAANTQRSTAADPDPSLELHEARIEIRYKLIPQAIARLDALRPFLENDAALLSRAGDAYLRAGQLAKALGCFKTADTLLPENANTLIGLARVHQLQGKHDEAQQLLDRLDEAAQSSAPALHIRGMLLAQQGEHAPALDTLKQAATCEGDPGHAEAVFQYANLLLSDQRAHEVQQLGKSFGTSTNRISRQTGGLLLGQLYLQKGLFDRAIATCDRVLEEHPNQFDARLIQAQAWFAQREYTKAEQVLLHFSERLQQSPDVMFILNRARYSQGDSPEMVAQLEAAVVAHPENLQLLIDLGNAHYFAGRFEQAREVYETYLAANPNNLIAANNLANVLVDQDVDLARAEELARRAVTAAPRNPLFTDTLGWILVKRGKAAEGLPYLEHTVRAYPKSAQARWHLAAAHEKMGNNTAALQHIQTAIAHSIQFVGIEQARAMETRLRREQRQ